MLAGPLPERGRAGSPRAMGKERLCAWGDAETCVEAVALRGETVSVGRPVSDRSWPETFKGPEVGAVPDAGTAPT